MGTIKVKFEDKTLRFEVSYTPLDYTESHIKVSSNGKRAVVGYLVDDVDPESPRQWDNFGTMVCWHRRYNLGDEQPKESVEEWQKRMAIAAVPELEDDLYYWEHDGFEARMDEFALKYPQAKHYEVVYYEDDNGVTQKIPSLCSLATASTDGIIEGMIGKALEENYVMLPLYLYDHSGITMSVSPFNCAWDSGMVGLIYVSKEQVIKEYGGYGEEEINKAISVMESEVATYDAYLRGEVYGFSVEGFKWSDKECKWVQVAEFDLCWGFYGSEAAEGGVKEAMDYHGVQEFLAGEDKVEYKCPACGSTNLVVVVQAWAALIQDGDGNVETVLDSDKCPDHNHDWGSSSTMRCCDCGRVGWVCGFGSK